MSRAASIYLDLIRFLAAVMVFVIHCGYERFHFPGFWRFQELGNDFVMVFFVLSGLVIVHVAQTKEKTLKDYAVSRLSRLYSVVAPALVVTVIVDYIGTRINPGLYEGWWFNWDDPVWRFIASFFFLNELWFASIKPFSNGPFWSLGYEFWYYVFFGAAFYVARPARYVALAVAVLIAGPKILLLFPVWLLGIWVYSRIKAKPVPEALGWGLFLGSVAGYVALRAVDGPRRLLGWTSDTIGGTLTGMLGFSGEFLASYIIGMLVALHFIGMAAVAPRLAGLLGRLAVPIRYLAGYTFSVYLFHFPLLQFYAAAGSAIGNAAVRTVTVLAATTVSIWVLGTISEKRRGDVRRWLLAVHDAIGRRVSLGKV